MKKKNILSLLLVLITILSSISLTGCSNGNTPTTEDPNTKIGSVGNENILYSEIKEDIESLRKELIVTRARELANNQFYKDIEVSDEEVQAQVDYYKEMYGTDMWDQFLMYNGFTNEDEFRTVIATDLKTHKKIEEMKKTIDVTDEELNNEYEEYKKSYDHIVVNAYSFPDDESYNTAKSKLANGTIFDEIGLDSEGIFYEAETISTEFEDFSTNMLDAKIGDILFTDGKNGAFIIALVEEVNFGFESNKDGVKDYLTSAKAEELITKEQEKFYENLKVVIDGEEITGTELMSMNLLETN